MAHKNQNSKSKKKGCCLRGENLRGGGLFSKETFRSRLSVRATGQSKLF